MLIKDHDKDQLMRIFAEKLVDPVELLLFTQGMGNPLLPFVQTCDWCRNTEELVNELVPLTDKLTVRRFDFVADKDNVDAYKVDKIPAIVPIAKKDYGVRFFGIPIGYEFTSLVEGIVDVSRGSADLGERTIERLADISTEITIQVFISPTCPYCPGAVRTAHRMAIASEKISGAMVEIQEFPHLAQRYEVRGVPKTVINETESFEGALPESLILLHVLKAAEIITPEESAQFDLYRR
jgi:glutaredoxin-like protein